MKKTFLFVLAIFSFSQLTFAIPKEGDTPHVDTPKKSVLIDNKKSKDHSVFDTVQIKYIVKKGDSVKVSFNSSKDSTSLNNCGCIPHPSELGFWQGLLASLPIIIFLIIFFSIGIPKAFAFKDALTENEQTRQTKDNPQYSVENLVKLKDIPNLPTLLPPTVDITSESGTYRPSISRYIAFITSLLTLIVALAMSSFFIYNYISTGCAPDLSGPTPILIALGIGVAPYAFNKVSTAVKGQSE